MIAKYEVKLECRGEPFAIPYAVHVWRTFPHGPDTLVGVGCDHTAAKAMKGALEEVRMRRERNSLGLNP